MPCVHQPLFVLHADPRLVARVERARPLTTRVVPVAGWAELRTGVATAAPGSLALVDPRHGRADGTLAPELAELCAAYPRLGVLAVTPFSPGSHGDALTLGRWGVSEVLRAGTDDRGASLSARLGPLYDSHAVRLTTMVMHFGSGWNRMNLLLLLHMAALRAESADWAHMFGTPEKVMRKRSRAVGLPSPRRLLAWARVILAADLLESPGHTVATVAAACGYAGDAPMRRVVHRLTGLTAAELAARPDPLRAAVVRFARELAGWGPLPAGW